MRLIETANFKKHRKKLKQEQERAELKNTIIKLLEDPYIGKKLKGEFKDLLALRYTVKGQSRRLIYKVEKDKIIMYSFGPREGIYR